MENRIKKISNKAVQIMQDYPIITMQRAIALANHHVERLEIAEQILSQSTPEHKEYLSQFPIGVIPMMHEIYVESLKRPSYTREQMEAQLKILHGPSARLGSD